MAERLTELHLAACQAADPDPVELATWLYLRQLADDRLDMFHGAVTRYADLLGEPGLATYRELAERDWAALPEPTVGGYGSRRYRLSSIL